MPKIDKNLVKVTYTLDKNVSDMIDKYNKETFVPKTKIVEEAVKAYINNKKNKTNEK